MGAVAAALLPVGAPTTAALLLDDAQLQPRSHEQPPSKADDFRQRPDMRSQIVPYRHGGQARSCDSFPGCHQVWWSAPLRLPLMPPVASHATYPAAPETFDRPDWLELKHEPPLLYVTEGTPRQAAPRELLRLVSLEPA